MFPSILPAINQKMLGKTTLQLLLFFVLGQSFAGNNNSEKKHYSRIFTLICMEFYTLLMGGMPSCILQSLDFNFHTEHAQNISHSLS